jgi:hypothetical protein
MLIMFIDACLRHPRRSLTGLVVVVLALIGVLWWNLVWQSPQRVFTDMLSNNLSTTSVTRRVLAYNSSQGLDQYIRLEMGSTYAAEWLVTAVQDGTAVTSDSVATLHTGYIRYTKITTGQSSSKKPSAFSHVLNVWGKSDGTTDTTLAQLFDQTVLDINDAPIPPIGIVSRVEDQTLVNYMLNDGVFSSTYRKVSTQTIQGHDVYTYQVLVHLGPYVRMMQSFAHALGISSLNSINPTQYSTVAPVSLSLSVDKMSHELVAVRYPASGFEQTYGGWGILTAIPTPQKTIPTTLLQSRIQSIK